MDNIFAFLSSYDAYIAKARYMKARSEYLEKPFAQRVFSRPLSDPARGLTLDALRDIVESSFSAAYPTLNFNYVGKDGERVMAKTEFIPSPDGNSRLVAEIHDLRRKVFNREYFVLEKGYGFVHEYQQSDNPQENIRNRNFAVSSSLASRMVGYPYDVFFQNLDEVRKNYHMRDMSYGKSLYYSGDVVFKEALTNILSYMDALQRDKELLYQSLDSLVCSPGIHLVSDFVDYSLKDLSTRDVLATYGRIDKEYEVFANDYYRQELDKVSSKQFYEDARRSHNIEYMEGRKSLDSILQSAVKEAGLDPQLVSENSKERFILNSFVENALDAGYPLKDISEYVDKHAGAAGISSGDSFRPAYDVIYEKKADMYLSIVLEQCKSAFGKGVKESSKVDIETPYGQFSKHFAAVEQKAAARDCLVKHYGPLSPYELDHNGFFLKGDASELGASIQKKGLDVSLEGVSSFTGLDAGKMEEGFCLSLGELFKQRLDINPGEFRKSSSLGLDIFERDIFNTAASLCSDGDCLTAGRFLMDAGVKLSYGNDCSCHDAVHSAAKGLYGNGLGNDALRTQLFRERWSSYINDARRASRNFGEGVKQEKSNVKQFKLS